MTTFLETGAVERVYDRIGALQDTQAFYEDPALAALLRHGAFERAHSVYEAGCGTGRVARRLLREVLPYDCRYVGADVSAHMLATTRSRIAAFPNACVIRADVAAFRPAGSFDRVLSLFVVDLMSDAQVAAFLRCTYDVLADGGLLCVAGLAEGERGIARAVSAIWKRVHDVAPAIVGGCRPGSIVRHLPLQRWRILEAEHQCAYGVSSEAVVAVKA